jgi:quercetin dioxygenase-like cupin family protein
MKHFRIESFTKGWIVGDFEPSLHKNSFMEVGVKYFKKDEIELEHHQNIATEITIVVSGTVSLNGKVFKAGDVIVVEPKEKILFKSITDSSVTCLKFPSIPNDKVLN